MRKYPLSLCYTSACDRASIAATGRADILITGNMASGKSSGAQALAEQLFRSVHLHGDLLRRMILNMRAELAVELRHINSPSIDWTPLWAEEIISSKASPALARARYAENFVDAATQPLMATTN